MLLIFPPVAKACEPPAGIAQLAATLKHHQIPCRLLDANLEGLLWLLQQPSPVDDTWSRRAAKHLQSHLNAVKSLATYSSPDRYTRAINDLNRLLSVADISGNTIVGLADYQHKELSPVRSTDLLYAAEHPEKNPFYQWFSARLDAAVEGVSTVGFSLNYMSQALSSFAMIGYLKKQFPKVRIILGGGLVTSWMRRPSWANPFSGLVDHLVSGAGEIPLLKLCGVDVIKSDRPTPDYSLLACNDYLSPGFVLPYSLSEGCYWNRCSFCPEKAEGNRYLPAPLTIAINDVAKLVAERKPLLLHLLDNAISPAFLKALAVSPPGIKWYGFARFENDLTNLDFCYALKRSGCAMLKLGLESGDQQLLDSLSKGIELAKVEHILDNLKKVGIATYVYLLFGTPDETEVEARKTLDFVIKQHEKINFLNLAIFNMPIAGAYEAGYALKPFYEGDLSLYTAFKHPKGWHRNLVRSFLEKEFKRNRTVASIIKNDPPQFTSNHAPFFKL